MKTFGEWLFNVAVGLFATVLLGAVLAIAIGFTTMPEQWGMWPVAVFSWGLFTVYALFYLEATVRAVSKWRGKP